MLGKEQLLQMSMEEEFKNIVFKWHHIVRDIPTDKLDIYISEVIEKEEIKHGKINDVSQRFIKSIMKCEKEYREIQGF